MAIDSWWRRAARVTGEHVEALLFPRICVACDGALASHRDVLACDGCWNRVSTLPHPRCERCGHPASGESCRWCPLLPAYVRAARSWCWVPGGTAERLVYALKYEGWYALAPEMAERMARLEWPEDVRRERAALVPVPLAADRQRTRGFNQSAKLAEALAPRMGIPVWDDVIERPSASPSQTRLTPEQRLRNVAGAFRVVAGAPPKLRGAHVMLVDDVVTTAATLNECATTLWNAGARIISYVTFGRARAAGDVPLTRG
jgi:ComF family protein